MRPAARKRNRVVCQSAGGNVLEGCAHGALAAFFFQVHQLAVARHAVGDPGVAERARAHFRTPPLVRDGVGQQADAALVAHARALNGGDLRGPHGGERIVWDLDHVETRGFVAAKASVKKSYCLVAVWASWLAEA